MEPWYRVVTLRKEVREGRSFSPDEFAIALEQVVADTAPEDYRDPAQFFARTCFTRALKEHAGMVLRRLSGRTENTAPVLTLINAVRRRQDAHPHLALPPGQRRAGRFRFPRCGRSAERRRLDGGSLRPGVGVFVGNAWDPTQGAGDALDRSGAPACGRRGLRGTRERGADHAAGGPRRWRGCSPPRRRPCCCCSTRVLNFVNRHRLMAEAFHAFLQNLTVAVTVTSRAAAVVSLPRSQVEMTDWDQQWQDRITKVVRRVARDLIANDESEISEVVRRRLFEDLGSKRVRKNVAKTYADWCFERSARLPAEWLAVDTATTESKAREFLRSRFEACYPFHSRDPLRLSTQMARAHAVFNRPVAHWPCWRSGSPGPRASSFSGRAPSR